MSKKIYELSKYTQAADKQRILKTSTGEEYNISFVPAMVNRKYYKRWTEVQEKLRKELDGYHKLKLKIADGIMPDEKDIEDVKKFKELTMEAAEAGMELLVYTIIKNGYSDFTEDELYENFSEADMAYAINFIMGVDVEALDGLKKNSKSKK